MKNMRLLILALSMLFPTSMLAQRVSNTWFCEIVSEKQCIGRIADGSEVDISALRNENGHPVLYLWGAIESEDDSVATIYFSREGTCAVEQIKLPTEKFESQPGFFQEARAFFPSLTLANLMNLLGVEEIAVRAVNFDIKLNVASIEASPRFRIHDFRYVICPGVLRARLFDSGGEPLAGNNDVRSVTVVSLDEAGVASPGDVPGLD